MTIEFTLSKRQQELREAIRGVAKNVIRPQSLAWDRGGAVPEDFLRNFYQMASMMGGNHAMASGAGEDATLGGKAIKEGDPSARTSSNLGTIMAAEELAWGDAGLFLNMPGPGLGAPPVKATGTPEQKERFFAIFKDMSQTLRWGAYALTEPGAGSDVAGIRTSARKDGGDWVLNGRKCYITNGARASWNVVFATIDPALGRAGHRAFVVEKGTPGFSVGRIEDKMGLRASETAELVFEDCRVKGANLLGGEASYTSKQGFMAAMKTFDNTRPLVASMAIGIGRAAYEYALDFYRENYRTSTRPRVAALGERLARVGRDLAAARLVTWRAGWLADHGVANAKEASMSKALGGQAAIHACIQAIEVCGAEGALSGEHQLLEKWFRDIKVFDIFEGTGQIQRVVISKRLIEGLKSF